MSCTPLAPLRPRRGEGLRVTGFEKTSACPHGEGRVHLLRKPLDCIRFAVIRSSISLRCKVVASAAVSQLGRFTTAGRSGYLAVIASLRLFLAKRSWPREDLAGRLFHATVSQAETDCKHLRRQDAQTELLHVVAPLTVEKALMVASTAPNALIRRRAVHDRQRLYAPARLYRQCRIRC